MGLPSGWLLLELPMALRWVTLSAMQSVLPLATRLGWQTVRLTGLLRERL